MPIPQITVTPSQFNALQQNIAAQSATFVAAANLAESGLTLVALLDDVAPTIDLIPGFAAHFTSIEAFDATANYTDVITALNNHIVQRGTSQRAGDNSTTRLNRWLAGSNSAALTPTQLVPERIGQVDMTPILVTADFATFSAAAGFVIDPVNIA